MRKKRDVHGENFKWDDHSNSIAYYCFRTRANKELKTIISEKYGMNPQGLDGRIQHFKSLTPESKSTTTNPSADTKRIFKELEDMSDQECFDELESLFGSAVGEVEVSGDPVQSMDDKFDDYFKTHWNMQRYFQYMSVTDLPLNDFLKVVSTMNVKSSGMKLELRFIKLNNLVRSKREEEGDAWLDEDTCVEVKTSFITPLERSSINLTGLRLWEDVKYYFFLVIDLRDIESGPKPYPMWVPKEKLVELDMEGKLGTPGMKVSDATSNKKVTKSLRIKLKEIEEWASNYPLPDGMKI